MTSPLISIAVRDDLTVEERAYMMFGFLYAPSEKEA